MYELWARSRTKKRYEYITQFEDERQSYYMMDTVDREEYSEVMVLQNQHLIYYQEFKNYEAQIPHRLTKGKYKK